MLDSASYGVHDVVSWREDGKYLYGRVVAKGPKTFTVEYREPGPKGKVVTKRFKKPPWGNPGGDATIGSQRGKNKDESV